MLRAVWWQWLVPSTITSTPPGSAFRKRVHLNFLPLSDGSCSIVWTLPSDRADYYLSLGKNDFKQALAEAFDHKLGNITKVGKRQLFHFEVLKPYGSYCLGRRCCTHYSPACRQGVNLGIKDVRSFQKSSKELLM